MESSDSWIINGPNKSIGYALADQGYDVWFANNRGNKYSEKHVKYDANKDAEFWEGCVPTNIGLYDIPAYI